MTVGLPLLGEKKENYSNRNHHRLMARMVHTLLCLMVGSYLALHYSAAAGPIFLLLCGALIAEWLPWKWRRWFIPECCLLAIALISYGWSVLIDDGLGGFRSVLDPSFAFAGWIRMTLVFWALVPSRQHMIKAVAGMTAGELILVANNPDLSLMVVGVLIGIIILSLFFETWLAHGYSAQDQVQIQVNTRRKPWTYAFITAFSLMFISISLGFVGKSLTVDSSRIQSNRESDGASADTVRHLSTTIGLDESSFTDQDPTVTARISWDESPASHQGMVYLRALTVPELYLANSSIRWRSSPAITETFDDIPQLSTDEQRRNVTLFRQRGSGELVLRPDHSRQVSLLNMKSDRDGNLFRTGIGDFPRKYQVDLGSDQSPPPHFEIAYPERYLSLPVNIRDWVVQAIPEVQRWRRMKPEAAAQSISRWIRGRTRYSTHNLPTPTQEPGGSLRKFLFGSEEERQGHCQFYSSASTILLRASGHQARPVLGFASDEYDNEGISFRALHAHAWTEFKNEAGSWQRLDATPGNAIAQRSSGIPIDENESFDSIDFAEDVASEASASYLTTLLWGIAILGILVSIVGLNWYIGNRGKPKELPAMRRLRKSTNALIACAQECGIPVQASSTLTKVVEELEHKSGIDLSVYLQQHLSARFGQGSNPPEWPLKEIKHAYGQRRTQGSMR